MGLGGVPGIVDRSQAELKNRETCDIHAPAIAWKDLHMNRLIDGVGGSYKISNCFSRGEKEH